MNKKSTLALAAFLGLFLAACTPTEAPDPDGLAEFTFAGLSQTLNSSLDKDYAVIIGEQKLYFSLPDELKDGTFKVSFSLTKDDVLYVNGKAVEGDAFDLTPSQENHASIVIKDEVSKLENTWQYELLPYDEAVGLLSLSFPMAINPDLPWDYEAEEISENINIGIPSSIIGKTLVANVAATVNDIVTVNGTEVAADGSISIDTSFPADIVVKDFVSANEARYVLTFSKAGATWSLAGSFAGAGNRNWVDMAMGSQYPYIAYIAKINDNYYPAVKKFNGTCLEQVGTEESIAIETRNAYITADKATDVPYIMFNDYNKVNNTTQASDVYKYDNGGWSIVGEHGAAAAEFGLAGYKMSFKLGVDGNPFIAFSSSAAISGGLNKRECGVSIFDGTSWSANQKVSGRTNIVTLSPRLATTSKATYLLAPNQTEKTFDLYKYENKAWSLVIDEFKFGGADEIGTYNVGLFADGKDNVYAMLTNKDNGSDWTTALYKVDGNTFTKAYNNFPGMTFNNSKDFSDVAFDKNGNPVVAAVFSTGDLVVLPFDDDTKDWGTPVVLGTGYYGQFARIGINDKGVVFVCAQKSEKVDGVTTITIDLYKGLLN